MQSSLPCLMCTRWLHPSPCRCLLSLAATPWRTAAVVQHLILYIIGWTDPGSGPELPAGAVEGLRELFAALPGLRQLLIEPDGRGYSTLSNLQNNLPCMLHAASIAVEQQVAWQGINAIKGKKAAGAEVAGTAAAGAVRGGWLHAVTVAAEGSRPQRKACTVSADCTAVTSAMHGLTAQVAMLRAGSAIEGGMESVHPALQAHVAGVNSDVLEACNAELAAAGVPHCMQAEWCLSC